MRKVLATAAAVVMMAGSMLAAEYKGRISDAMCNAKHAKGEHGTKEMTDRQCVEACVKGGEKYVFVGEGDKVYKIDNQDFAGLKTHAGHEVTVTGTMKDNTVTITKIEMPAAKK
jgi:ADP-glucose pyrophosphorylase